MARPQDGIPGSREFEDRDLGVGLQDPGHLAEEYAPVGHVAQDEREIDIDARPSDSIALAVRARVPIYVADAVMDAAGVYPAVEIHQEGEDLSVFRDFFETLDLGEE